MTINWTTPAGLLFTATEGLSTSTSIVATGTNISYGIISGKLPTGMTLSSTGVISGTPSVISLDTASKFVVRATSTSSIADRTFIIDVTNVGGPYWITTSSYLPVGYLGADYVFNSQWVDYKLETGLTLQLISTQVNYNVVRGKGTLPPGLTLSNTGTISGFVTDRMTFDGFVSATGGFDTEKFDGYSYDHAVTFKGTLTQVQLTSVPKIYQFDVVADDGDNKTTSSFKIMVVNPDIFRTDFGGLAFNTTGTTATLTATISTGTINLSTLTNITTMTGVLVGDYVTILGDSNNALMKSTTKVSNISTTGTVSLSTGTLNAVSTGSVVRFYRYVSAYDALAIDTTPGSVSYLVPPQFLNGSNLGMVRANNNVDLDVSAYDGTPNVGTLTYTLITSTNISTQLPNGVSLDNATGHLVGYIPYQPAYTRSYALTIEATKHDNNSTATISVRNTFSLLVAGNVFSSIEWLTGEDLGSIEIGITSDLAVVAQEISSSYNIKYQLTGGTLPIGLTLGNDGALIGSAAYGSSGSYSFTVTASDVYGLSAISRTFKLAISTTNNIQFSKLYIRPFLSQVKRQQYADFINNDFTFDPKLIYRYSDPNFGVQHDIKMYLEYALESLNLNGYMQALYENFYRRKLYFGDVKVATARDPNTGAEKYEVVYVEVVDPNMTKTGESVTTTFYTNENQNIYYPSSISNMRIQLEALVSDQAYVSVNPDGLPLFMRTAQPNEIQPPGYLPVMILCYAFPGSGAKIAGRVRRSKFDFKQINFEIDRVIVSNSLESGADKYLMLERQSLSDPIPQDNLLFGFDDVEILFDPNQGNDTAPLNAESGEILTDENGIPLEL
jgi:hypothetical protein